MTLNSSAGIFSPAGGFVVASSASSLGDTEVRRRLGIAAEGGPGATPRRLVTGAGAPVVVDAEQRDGVSGGGHGGAARRHAGAAIQVRRAIERGARRLGLDLEHQH